MMGDEGGMVMRIKASGFALAVVLSGCMHIVAAVAGTPVGLRINTSHGLGNARGAVMDAGLKLSTEVDVTASSPYDGRPFLPPNQFMADARNAGAIILSSSFSGWDYIFDSAGYLQLTHNEMLHVFAYEPRKKQPLNVPPPAVFVTVNRIGGLTGDGVEFGVPTDYMNGKGQSTTPSGVTAQLAGLIASLKYLHQEWNWFDIKAALRGTASNYTKGYDPQKYGYGTVDFHAANALKESSKLPLFAPAAIVRRQRDNQVDFFVNSFMQSRRQMDVLFKFSLPPSVTLKELSLADITGMGGQQLFIGDLSTTSNFISYRVHHDEKVYFVWFTKDEDGMFSRIEPYSIIGPVKLTSKQQLYGPRVKP
jgi:hypothetical protein